MVKPADEQSTPEFKSYPIPPGVIAYNILKVPLFYTMIVTILTHVLRRQIVCWFEHVLYIDDEEGEGPNSNQDGALNAGANQNNQGAQED